MLGVLICSGFKLKTFQVLDVLERFKRRLAEERSFTFEHLEQYYSQRPQVTCVGSVGVRNSLWSDIFLRAYKTVVPTHVALRLIFKDRGITVLRFADLAVKVIVKDLASREVDQLYMVMFI